MYCHLHSFRPRLSCVGTSCRFHSLLVNSSGKDASARLPIIKAFAVHFVANNNTLAVIGRRYCTISQSALGNCVRRRCRSFIGQSFRSDTINNTLLTGFIKRKFASRPGKMDQNQRTYLNYAIGTFLLSASLSYAAVPLYRAFCQTTGYGGNVKELEQLDFNKISKLKPVRNRMLTVRFNSDMSSRLAWSFKPLQRQIKLAPGETALAFYSAKNETDVPIDGIATYNVVPFDAGAYFNKIQCFCFEEQRLNPGEEVDMPVFFFIDPDYVYDPLLVDCDEITLSYTFFQAKPGLKLPLPGYATLGQHAGANKNAAVASE